MPSEKLTFPGTDGAQLAARLDMPAGAPRATALFAHCFTCTKDIFAASRIAQTLNTRGIAVLRFDFTGLGHSEGEFANTNFTSNVDDLLAAAGALSERSLAPEILIGHSLGGAAVLAAAGQIDSVKAVATIGAPADPGHVSHLFAKDIETIESEGEAEVKLAGRPFRIRKQFLDDIASQPQRERIHKLKAALLVMHAPRDELVSIDNAAEIFGAAHHPKSFISLDTADHLLTRHEDAAYVATMIAEWASRFIAADAPERPEAPPLLQGFDVVVSETGAGGYQQLIRAGRHELLADEPEDVGGMDSGPGPYDLLAAALGACTAMTLRMYANHKDIPLEGVSVQMAHQKIHAKDCEDCESDSGRIDRIDRRISIAGDLDEEVRQRLLEIADKCPVHKTLHSEVKVVTELED